MQFCGHFIEHRLTNQKLYDTPTETNASSILCLKFVFNERFRWELREDTKRKNKSGAVICCITRQIFGAKCPGHRGAQKYSNKLQWKKECFPCEGQLRRLLRLFLPKVNKHSVKICIRNVFNLNENKPGSFRTLTDSSICVHSQVALFLLKAQPKCWHFYAGLCSFGDKFRASFLPFYWPYF